MKKKNGDMTNMVIAFVLSLVILTYWQVFIEAPRKRAEAVAYKAKTQAEEIQKQAQETHPVEPVLARGQILSQSPRLHISSPRLHGSLALKGLRLDDLTLAQYHETLAADSPEVVLFTPGGSASAYFAEFGWLAEGSELTMPDDTSLWKADSETLTPGHPATLTWENPQGAIFAVKIALDDKYMFTLNFSATGKDGKPLSLSSYTYINRIWDMKTHPKGYVHEGPLGVFDATLKEEPYKSLTEDKEQDFEAQAGWLGIADKYWLSAIIPAESFHARYTYYVNKDSDHFQVDYFSPHEMQSTVHFFAGAKELSLLDGYAAQYRIPLFERSVDFGMFYWLAEPIFRALAYFNVLIGNFGLAILLLTVIVKMALYPLASKSFIAMNRMKDLSPKMKDIQERYKDDKMKLQQETIALYKREKVNPASGCFPMLIQFPVFLALYKVLSVTIEMRHAPFYGWIHDLSAPDPTNIFTLFGLIAWQPPSFLHLGILPLLMCATMFIQQMQSPPSPDPVQARMFKAMPFVMLFIFSGVAAGLVIYWTWSNLLSILQQAYIRHRYGTKPAAKAAP